MGKVKELVMKESNRDFYVRIVTILFAVLMTGLVVGGLIKLLFSENDKAALAAAEKEASQYTVTGKIQGMYKTVSKGEDLLFGKSRDFTYQIKVNDKMYDVSSISNLEDFENGQPITITVDESGVQSLQSIWEYDPLDPQQAYER